MKRLFLACLTGWILLPASPCFADFIITLKSGSELRTVRYWKEGGEIKFHTKGGVTGIPEEYVTSIVERASDPTESTPPPAEIMQPSVDPIDHKKVKPEKAAEKNPLQEFYDRKKTVEIKLNNALKKLREATGNKDKAAKEKARQDMRKFSTEIYAITEEIKEKNGGKLPEDWWKGNKE